MPPLCTVIAPWLEPVALTVRLNPFAAVILEFVPPIRIVGPVTTAKAAELVKVPPPVTATWPVVAVTVLPPVKVPPVTVTLRVAVVVPEASEPPTFTMTSLPAVAVVVDAVPAMLMLLASDFTKFAALMDELLATVTEPVTASTVSRLVVVPVSAPPPLTMTAPVVPLGSAAVALTVRG